MSHGPFFMPYLMFYLNSMFRIWASVRRSSATGILCWMVG